MPIPTGFNRLHTPRGYLWRRPGEGSLLDYFAQRAARSMRAAGRAKNAYSQRPQWEDNFFGGAVDARWTQTGLLTIPGGAGPRVRVSNSGATNGSLTFGGNVVTNNTLNPIVEVVVLPNDTTQRKINLGLQNQNNTDATQDFIFFQNDVTGSAANWFGACDKAGTATTVDLGTALDTTNFVTLRFVVDNSVPIVRFYINDVYKGMIITNIPTVNLQPACTVKRADLGTHTFDMQRYFISMDRSKT